jgi:Flp pilus assembly protein TadG
MINRWKARGRRNQLVREERRWRRKGLFRRRRRGAWKVALGILLVLLLAAAAYLFLAGHAAWVRGLFA